MSETVTKVLNNRLNRQLVIQTSEKKTPETTFNLPPRGVRKVALTQEQVSYLSAKYTRRELVVS